MIFVMNLGFARVVSLVGLLPGLLAAPLLAQPQQYGRTARVGILAAAPPNPEGYKAFRQGLLERGWVEGKNLVLDFRSADNQYDLLPALATELVALKPDVIFAVAAPAIRAAMQATSTIPVVIEMLGDAQSAGFVADLARPGGNVTGVSGFAPELIGKRVQLIRDILPKADAIGVLANLANPATPPVVRATEAAARQLGVRFHVADIREARDLAGAFDQMARHAMVALVVVSDPTLHTLARQVVELAERHRLPTVYEQRLFPDAGGLLSYGPGDLDRFQRVAVYVDRILRGAKPFELPVERPTKFEMVINLKAAKALRLALPQSVLWQADQVIQ
ncbi:MAG: ABC transporter substrate-binding protein [Betaproteobacteria bacterium]